MKVVNLADLYAKFSQSPLVTNDDVVELEDYPEPLDAKWVCTYCGKKTRDEPTLVDDEENNQTLLFKTRCARSACFDASTVDPDFRATYPFGHRPS